MPILGLQALRNYSGPADRNRKLKEVANLKVLGNHEHCVRYVYVYVCTRPFVRGGRGSDFS